MAFSSGSTVSLATPGAFNLDVEDSSDLANAFTVNNTPAGALTLDTAQGAVDVKATTGTLAVATDNAVTIGDGNTQAIKGAVSINGVISFIGLGGESQLGPSVTIDDSKDTAAHNVSTALLNAQGLPAHVITGLAPATITIDNAPNPLITSFVRSLTLIGDAASGATWTVNDAGPQLTTLEPNTAAVNVTATEGPLVIKGGSTVAIGQGSLAPITAPVVILANPFGSVALSAAVTVDDSSDTASTLVQIGQLAPTQVTGIPANVLPADSVTGLGAVPLFFDGTSLKSLTIRSGQGTRTFSLVGGIVRQLNLTITPQSSNNTLIGPDIPNGWVINGPNQGTLGPNILFSGMANLTGGAFSDSFAFVTTGKVSGSLTGNLSGGGVNSLNYSGYTGDVIVDLPLGTAIGVGGTISAIETVTGSKGNDILVGNAVTANLTGGTGRNLLIAGPTPTTLIGGPGDDILVGGTTSYDTNTTALAAIILEWTSSSTYAQRVQHLLDGGGKNGTTLLNQSTFSFNLGGNTMTGGAGLDLFYGYQPTDVTDYNKAQGEVFINDKSFDQTSIDTSALSIPELLLDSQQLLPKGVSPFATLTPGPHTLTDFMGGGNSVSFTVASNGTVDYAHTFDSVLSGRGTNTLVVNGVQASIDATALGLPQLLVNGMSEFANGIFSITTLPGTVTITDPALAQQPSNVQFTLNPDGSYNYASAPPGMFSLEQNGTVLQVNGLPLAIDTHLLSEAVALDTTPLNGGLAATATVHVLPGNHMIEDGSGNSVAFVVNPDDSVTFPATPSPALSTAGPGTLTVNGLPVTIDAYALADPNLGLDNFAISFAGTAPYNAVLLPGTHSVDEAPGGSVAFQVLPDGNVDYDTTSGQTLLSGSGSTTLTVNGLLVIVDAQALTAPTVTLDGVPFATTSNYEPAVLPGTHVIQEPQGGSVPFQVTEAGDVTFDPMYSIALTANAGVLTVNGLPLDIAPAAITEPGLYLDGSQTAFDPTQGLVAQVLPGDHTLRDAAGGSVAFTLSPADGLDYATQLNAILGGRNDFLLHVLGLPVTINATALGDQTVTLDGGETFNAATPFAALLLPGMHTLQPAGANVVAFTVYDDGTVDYAMALDSVLSGRTLTTLTWLA